MGESLRSDPATQYKVEGWLQTAVTHLLARYGNDIAELISTTVARWDTKETSRRIELQVGRDLQFIRVNGHGGRRAGRRAHLHGGPVALAVARWPG